MARARLPRLAVVSHSAIEPTYQRKWEGVARAGFSVHLLVPRRWPETGRWLTGRARVDGGLSVGTLAGAWPGRVARWLPRGLGGALAAARPDLILAEEEPYGAACWLAARAARRLRVPFIFYTWENLRRRYPWPQELLLRRVATTAAGAIAGNREGLGVLRGWGVRRRVTVIPQYGVDGRAFRPRSRTACRRRLGWSTRGSLVGFIGRWLPEKGIETLLDAVALLPRGVHAVVVGAGPHEAVLRQRARPLGDRVRFAPPVPRSRVPLVLGALDVLVLPSRTTPAWKEQFGRVLPEAQACGRWAVGSDSGEIPHVLGSRQFVFPEGRPRALAGRLRGLLGRRPPASLRAGALARYSEDAVARATARFLDTFVRGRLV